MKTVLLIGLGRFGRYVAMKLSELKHEVLAVDIEEERVNQVLSSVTSAQIGDCTNPLFLSSLGVRNFDLCIVAIGDDFQSSLEVTSLLKENGAKKVVARASGDVQEKFLLRNGADDVVYPEKQLASWIAVRFTSDNILGYRELDESNGIFDVIVPEEWVGKTIKDLDIRRRYNLNIIGFRLNSDKIDFNVLPDQELKGGEVILVLGSKENVHKCFRT